MAYSQAFQNYLAGGGTLVLPLLEVDWPGGRPTGRYSTTAFSVPGLGHVEDRVPAGSFGDIEWGVDWLAPGFQAIDCRVVLSDDEDHPITQILEGSSDCRRVPCRVKRAVPGLAPADWDTRLVGVLDSWEWLNSAEVALTVRTDQRWLDTRIPRFPALKSEWANLTDAFAGTYLRHGYGIHNSQNLGGHGFWPTTMVRFTASSLRWDAVAHGVFKAVPRVYQNGVQKTLTTHYTISYDVVGGKTWTLIKWVAGQIPAETDEVTCDVEGYTVDGTTSGALITNPVTQIRHWIVNFGWGQWKTGAWLSETGSPIEPASWAAAEAFAARAKLSEGTLIAGGSTEQRQVKDVVDEWLSSRQLFRPYWNPDGRLAMGFLDPTEWPGYGTGAATELLREDEEVGRSLALKLDPLRIANRVSASYAYDEVSGSSWASMDVQDLLQTEAVTQQIRMTLGPRRF